MSNSVTDKQDCIKRIMGGTVTTPKGFKAAGVACGLKASGKLDLAMLVSDEPASCAGVFTTNKVRAACVDINRQRVKAGVAQAIVVNSGIANAYTGAAGYQAAVDMCNLAAIELNIGQELVLGASTGVIGEPLPMDKIHAGITASAQALSPDGGMLATQAIMTTDTVPKSLACEALLSGGSVFIGIMAKGSGMIEPNLATMLSFITTDAYLPSAELQQFLTKAVDQSFNCVTVDGDSSTNDMALMLANGASGVAVDQRDKAVFQEALNFITREMAKAIAADGEGATKLVEITVAGAVTSSDAKLAAKAIANSPLTKTAIFGEDPNWGRILAAAGRSGADVDQERLTLRISGVVVVDSGEPVRLDPEVRKSLLKGDFVEIELDLNLGECAATVWTCDFSYDYVKINAEYHT